MWPLVIIGNTKGEMVMSEEQVAEIHQRLEHLTAEQWVSQVFFYFSHKLILLIILYAFLVFCILLRSQKLYRCERDLESALNL